MALDFSFFRFERSFVVFLVFWVFYAYGPAAVTRPVANASGVLASFQDTTPIAGVERPFFFGLATAAAHVEDEARGSWFLRLLAMCAPRVAAAETPCRCAAAGRLA